MCGQRDTEGCLEDSIVIFIPFNDGVHYWSWWRHKTKFASWIFTAHHNKFQIIKFGAKL